MTSLLKIALKIAATGAVLVTAEAAIFPVAALAQAGSTAEIIVYGTDPCPRSTDDDIVVCTRRPEEERYRLAPNLRPSGTRQERSSWANRAQDLKSVGSTGIGSCSAVGPGGSSGCLIQDIDRAMRETDEAADRGAAPE
ncbi:MAG: hypothetical protein ABIS39_01270 [Sphingomicrobium sp.]